MASRKKGRRPYADFGFTPEEVPACLRCDNDFHTALQNTGYGLTYHAVPISDYCPVAGLVAVCKTCEPWVGPETFLTGKRFIASEKSVWATDKTVNEYKSWHPPAVVQPARGVPMYVLRRGALDDDRLARCLARTWNRLPGEARDSLLVRWQSKREQGEDFFWVGEREYDPFCEGGCAWKPRTLAVVPGTMPLGLCLNRGHAIRLNARYAKPMPDAVLEVLLAHELGHCYQYAASKRTWLGPNCEAEVISLMAEWGFRNQDIDEWQAEHAVARRRNRLAAETA